MADVPILSAPIPPTIYQIPGPPSTLLRRVFSSNLAVGVLSVLILLPILTLVPGVVGPGGGPGPAVIFVFAALIPWAILILHLRGEGIVQTVSVGSVGIAVTRKSNSIPASFVRWTDPNLRVELVERLDRREVGGAGISGRYVLRVRGLTRSTAVPLACFTQVQDVARAAGLAVADAANRERKPGSAGESRVKRLEILGPNARGVTP